MVCLVTGFEAQAFHQSWQPVSIGLGGRVWRILLGPCAPYSDCSLESPGSSSMHLPGRTVPFCPTTGSSHQDILFLGDLCSITHVLPFLCFTLDLSHISSQVTMDIIYLRTPLAFLLLPLVVLGAPTDELHLTEPAPGACRRCCDPPDSSADAPPPPSSHHHLPYPMPEIRPYINITILKGECSSWPQSAKTS